MVATNIAHTVNNTADLALLAEAMGSHFFDKDALRFFSSRVHRAVYAHRYFVTSEQQRGVYISSGWIPAEPRAYTVREFRIEQGRMQISSIGDFQQYATRQEAHAAAQQLARDLVTLSPVEISNACLAAREALMWSSTVVIDDKGTVIEAENAHANLSDDAIETLEEQVRSFIAVCQSDPMVYSLREQDPEQLGHDFILTKNGHGAGFWDRGLGQLGERLSYWARTFGTDDLYISSTGELEIA